MTGQLHHTITFPFNCTFVPKGGRVLRDERLASKHPVAIPTADESEVEVAYRIATPEHEPVRVLSFEGRLWWPLNFGYDFCLRECWAEDFLERLGTNATWVLQFLRCPGDPWRYRLADEIVVRSMEKSDEDQVLARIQRTISEHVLLVGDRAFGRGGQPVYLSEPPGRRRRRRRPDFAGTRVASAGADRAADYVDGDFREAAGCFGNEWVQERFRRGEFQLADQVEATLFGPLLYGLPAPKVERLIAAPAEPFDAATIRLDALFRQTRNFLNGIPANGWVGELYKSQRATKERLRKKLALVEEGAVDAATSTERFDCLKEFLAFLKSEEGRMRIRPYFESLAREIEEGLPELRVFEPVQESLSAQDEEALASLA